MNVKRAGAITRGALMATRHRPPGVMGRRAGRYERETGATRTARLGNSLYEKWCCVRFMNDVKGEAGDHTSVEYARGELDKTSQLGGHGALLEGYLEGSARSPA